MLLEKENANFSKFEDRITLCLLIFSLAPLSLIFVGDGQRTGTIFFEKETLPFVTHEKMWDRCFSAHTHKDDENTTGKAKSQPSRLLGDTSQRCASSIRLEDNIGAILRGLDAHTSRACVLRRFSHLAATAQSLWCN